MLVDYKSIDDPLSARLPPMVVGGGVGKKCGVGGDGCADHRAGKSAVLAILGIYPGGV